MTTNSIDQAGPARGIRAVNPSNTEDLPLPARALEVTTAGNIKITDGTGHTATWAVGVGPFRCRVRRVWDDDLTAVIAWAYVDG